MLPLKIKFRDREVVAARCPTRAECDLVLIEGLFLVLQAKQADIVAANESGEDGCSVVIARACAVCNDASKQIHARVLGAAKAIGASVAELEDPDDLRAFTAANDWFVGLRQALGVGSVNLGKS